MKEIKTWKEVAQSIMDGEEVEVFNELSEKWVDVLHFPHFRITDLPNTPNQRYRIKPRTIMVGDIEVPEPVMDASEFNEGDSYYLASPTDDDLYEWSRWDDDPWDLLMLKRGLIHKIKEAAILHAKALIKISGGGCD